MKKSNSEKSRAKRQGKSRKGSSLGEIPPIVIKSGGGVAGERVREGTVDIHVNRQFDMKVFSGRSWKTAYVQRWDYHEFNIYIGEDEDERVMCFPLTKDTLVLLTLSTGWVKFRAEPREFKPEETALWIEASDYIFRVVDEQPLPDNQWMNSQASGLITRVEVYPQNPISIYSCPSGYMHAEISERTLQG